MANKEYHAAYRAAHKDERREYSAKYYAANTEKLKSAGVVYYAAHREERKAHQIAYHAANQEKRKAYTLKNRDKFQELHSKHRANNEKVILESIRHNGCPMCGPVDGYIDIYDFVHHHIDPAEKEYVASKRAECSTAAFLREFSKGLMLHYRCHTRLHCARHLGKGRHLRPPLPGETRQEQFDRLARACREEIESEKKTQVNWFLK